MSKTKLTQETGKRLKAADEGKDDSVQKFAPFSKIDGKGVSAALECKRILEGKGTEGAKSLGKSEKRELNRAISKFQYFSRDSKETLSGLKYQAPSRFTDEDDGFMNLYHIYSCYELGYERVATRRIPCHCDACKLQMSHAWMPGTAPCDQPRFQLAANCKYKNGVFRT